MKGSKMTTNRKERRQFNAQEKVEAVLSIWAERRKGSAICREMAINWGVLNHWQNRALEGMLSALEPRKREEASQQPALGLKLQQLLQKKLLQREGKASKLEQRLAKIQEAKESQGKQG